MNDDSDLDCLHLLIELVRLDRQGKNDSDEAEEIRYKTDPLWLKMTDEQKEVYGKISELLG